MLAENGWVEKSLYQDSSSTCWTTAKETLTVNSAFYNLLFNEFEDSRFFLPLAHG